MGRKSEFTDAQVFGWLARHLVHFPEATVHQVSKGTGVSVGSLYHRYGSLDNLFAMSWLWALTDYHERTCWLFERKGIRPSVRAARQVLAMAEAEPDKAMILFCIPRRVLVRVGASEAVLSNIATLESEWETGVSAFAQRSGFEPERLWLALRDVPCAILCRSFPHDPIPLTAATLLEECCRALLEAVPSEAKE